SLARLELNVMHGQTGWYMPQRHTVANFRLNGIGGADDHRTIRQPTRGENVAAFAVLIFQQRDMARAVGIVLNADHRGGHIVFGATEVDAAIAALMTATAAAHGDLALHVATASSLQRRQQRLLRRSLGDLSVEIDRSIAPGVGRRFVNSNGHGKFSSLLSAGFLKSRRR